MKWKHGKGMLAAMAVLLAGACTAKETPARAGDTLTIDSGTMTQAGKPMATPEAQMQAVLDQLASFGGNPIETLTAAEARQQPTPTDAVKKVLEQQGKPTTPDPAVTSVDRNIMVPTGSLPVRIYTPKSGNGPFPVVVYYHGGGWVIADKEVYDGGARGLSKLANAVVVSVDYRRGPENKFPAAHDDAYATYEWALANAASIKGDPKKVALAGESAGGGLAVATAIMARDKKVQMPLAIVSVYPIAGTDMNTPSYTENATAKPLNRAMMAWFFDNYLNGAQDRTDPRVNLVAANLAGLPPTTIINAQIDPLRSDGEILADKLRAAGVNTTQRTFEAVTHEFFGMAAVIDKALEAQQMAANALKEAFGN
ncbi:MAG: alpha/beta hydrolase [Gemmatimonadota bacterium]|nr:alpha/beta hydrolase [Gemmatimonadota bacterium]